MKIKFFFAFLAISCASSVAACTNVLMKATDQTVIVGRTMEFAQELQSRVINSSRNKKFQTQMNDGTATIGWSAKYGYLLVDGLKKGFAIDGMNEQGLSFGYLYLPGYTTYPSLPTNQFERALPYYYLGDWVLGNFTTVSEVERALKQITIYAEPMAVNGQEAIFPLHAIISDKSGESIVVEFVRGKIKVFKNSLGILTNAPTFPWHLNNLKNYINLSPYAPKPMQIDGFIYSGTGQGSGLVGLPGDPTPPARFVKMAILQRMVIPPVNAAAALILTEHILNTVDIPYGLVRADKVATHLKKGIEKTQWTLFKDLSHNRFYFKSYQNPSLQMIDLNKIDFSEKAPIFALDIDQQQPIIDSTNKFINP